MQVLVRAQEHVILTLRFAGLVMIAIFTGTAGSVLTVSAQDVDREAIRARLQERLTEARGRLHLTDDQIEQIKPILRAGVEAQMEVLQKHGIDLRNRTGANKRLGFRTLRRLGRDLDAVRTQTIEKLDTVLTDEQIKEYKKIQEERKQAMRKRLRQRRR